MSEKIVIVFQERNTERMLKNLFPVIPIPLCPNRALRERNLLVLCNGLMTKHIPRPDKSRRASEWPCGRVFSSLPVLPDEACWGELPLLLSGLDVTNLVQKGTITDLKEPSCLFAVPARCF